jgi:hypothetical protein
MWPWQNSEDTPKDDPKDDELLVAEYAMEDILEDQDLVTGNRRVVKKALDDVRNKAASKGR